jgi:DNA-3-methyladenine glycosylase I
MGRMEKRASPARRRTRDTGAAPRTGTAASGRNAAKKPVRSTSVRATQPRPANAAAPRTEPRLPPTPSFLPDDRPRCAWSYAGMSPEYVHYHDTEWGVPLHDDRGLFEFLVLEGAQAGLSWSTILRKREGYREAFASFDAECVARYDARKVEQLLRFPGIVRNRLKVLSAITNARCFLQVQEEFGSFDAYSWGFVGGEPIVNRWTAMKQVPATSRESDAFSKDLRKRGFKFVGSTIMYAHMQATGMVNDHVVTCFRHAEIINGRSKKEAPSPAR